jgi:predicted nucleic acid-binding protein
VNVYVDSSVLLRWLLKQPEAIQDWGDWEIAVTSALTRVEARRTVDRLRVQRTLLDEEISRLALLLRAALAPITEVPLSSAILERAGSPLPTALGALDAIHLATALAWIEDRGEPLTFLTHDRQLAIGAQACGLDVGPASPRPRRR